MVLDKLGIKRNDYTMQEASSDSYEQALEYNTQAGNLVTYGKVRPSLLRNFDIEQEVYAAEFNFDRVLQLHKKESISFVPLPRFPEVRRDLSLLLDKAVTFETLHSLAFRTERKLLKQVDLFDVYQGDKIEKGKKSYALSFVLLDENKTLTDKQIDKVMSKIAQVFEKETGAIIRGA
jgi:phenylalanyl-tRNA synthetase beta chain